MDLRKENYSLKGLCLSICFLACANLFSQSTCKVWVASEPTISSVSKLPSKVEQTSESHNVSWEGTQQALTKDGQNASIDFTKSGFSNVLKFSDFGLNIPEGATIHGIKLKLKGRSEGEGYVKDYLVKISNGLDKGGQGYNSKNVWAKGNTDKIFYYGFHDDNWGSSLNSYALNASNFGVEIQIMNAVNKPVKAFFDYIELEVFFTPLATFCLSDCFPVYIDEVDGAASYLWHFPPGFEMISRSEEHRVIDFKVMNATPGLHQVCIDVIDENGDVIDNCCRTIRLRNCTPASLGNFVWNDINYNGVQDSGEPGLANVKVDLYGQNNVLVQTKNTDGQGRYSFTNIAEGNYYVVVNVPSAYLISKITSTTEDKDNDFINQTQNRSASFFVSFGTNSIDLDFGLVKKLMIGDFVWEDLNYNGIQDANEKGIPDVWVFVKTELGVVVDSVKTNGSGMFLFQNLPADKYILDFKTPLPYRATKNKIGTADKDSDIKDNAATDIINFQNTDNNKNIDAGFIRLASIGDFVWEDVNKNGLQDVGEAGTADVLIYLYSAQNQLLDSTYTDANGNYIFDGLLPGQYYLKPVLPSDAFATLVVAGDLGSDLITVNGQLTTAVVDLNSNDQLLNIDLGYQLGKSVIGGLVWMDADNNGQYENSETTVANVWVFLFDDANQVLDSVLTDTSGYYSFEDLSNGGYKIGTTLIESNQFTDANIGSDDTDSDILDRINDGKTDVFVFNTSDTLNNVFIGISNRSKIGDFIWEDVNFNGQQDNGEPGFQDVVVQLLDEHNVLLKTTTTDHSGFYFFDNIATGNYTISIQIPSLYLVSTSNPSDSLIDNDVQSNGSSLVFTVPLGEDRLDIDGALIKKLTIGDFVWEDKNGNGIQDVEDTGIGSVVINLYDENDILIRSTTSSSIGQYGFTDVPASKYYITVVTGSDFIPTGLHLGTPSNDNDLKFDFTTDLIDFNNSFLDNTVDLGFFRRACIGDLAWIDVNEDGLLDGSDEVLEDVLINLYNASGQLIKISITDSLGQYHMCDLNPGSYYMEVIPNTAFIPTIKGNHSILFENDIQPFYSDTFDVESGAVLNDKDLGFLYRPTSKICGFVWQDDNSDGIYDANEVKIENQVVFLLDENKITIDQTVTDAFGSYCFLDLGPDTYFVQFNIGNSLQFTEANIGTDDLDSDAIGLVDSAQTEAIILMGSNDQMSVSAGVTKRSAVGNFVWFDTNKNGLQDVLELGMPTILVQLLDINGQVVQSTTTSFNPDGGKYLFQNVVKGNYKIKFASLPSLDFTIKDVDAVLGSDANPDGTTDEFVVLPNADNLDIDAAYALKGAGVGGIVWKDNNKDTVRTLADTILINIGVRLMDENHVEIASTVTNDDGEYVFFPVPAGNYYIKFDSMDFHTYQAADPLFIYNDVTNANGRGTTNTFTLTDGTVVGGIDGALIDFRSSVSGIAWNDKNGNGILQTDEGNVNNLWVYLIQDSINIDSTLTNADGSYTFENVFPGIYHVGFDAPDSNFVFTLKYSGLDTLKDSDVNLSGWTDSIQVENCQEIIGINAGFRGYGVVRGVMFKDENENGLYDDTLGGINNIHVCILDKDNNIIKIDTTQTINNQSGVYVFEQILAGEYKIKIRRPLFHVFSEKDVNSNTNDDIDSDVFGMGNFDALSDNFILEVNEERVIDGGLIFRVPMDSKISGYVWEEAVFDGLRDVSEQFVEGIELILFSELNVEISRTTSDENGYYEFDGLSEGFYYVKSILEDSLTTALYQQGIDAAVDNDFFDGNDLDATDIFYLGITKDTNHIDLGIANEISVGDFVWDDYNDNGIQDEDEIGISNVVVNLVLANNVIYKTTETSNNGIYSFGNLPEGEYKLEFKIPGSYSAAHKNIGDLELDSDINANGFTDLLTFSVENTTVDAGMVKNGSIGNRIWVDLNSNGIQENGEPGLNGATLKLYDENNTFIAETSSSSTQGGIEGIYNFFNVRPGNYYVEIDGPEGYVITRYNIGLFILNSDLMMDGFTDVFTVLPDEMKEDIDAGFYLPACIGDRVWSDDNKNGIQDEGESGLADVEVILTRSNGQVVDTLITDDEGKYLFTELTQGLYSVRFLFNEPYKATLQDAGEDYEDSDIDSTGSTALISLAHGAKFLDLDAGLIISTQLQKKILQYGLIEDTDEVEISVFPNPALNNIAINDVGNSQTIIIYDENGKVMRKFVSTQSTERLTIGDFPAGKYYIICKNNTNIKQTSFVKFD